MISYVPKRNRFVSLLSTYHQKLEYTDTEKKKPSIITFYNQTKMGVDTMDQLVGTYTCSRKVNRWPMVIFSNMLDISAINAFITFTAINPDWNSNSSNKNIRRRLFLVEMANQLIKPFADRRQRMPFACGSQHSTIHRLEKTGKRGRCHVCTSSKNRNVFATRCEKCEIFVCDDHKYIICSNCANLPPWFESFYSM